MKQKRLKHIFFFYFLMTIVVGAGIPSKLYAEADPFPLYPSIEPNVDFWKKIYSVYSTEQGVIHDKSRLDIIYGVIDLKNPDLRGSRKINRDRIKKAKKTYKAILQKLARGEAPSGAEEQRVAALFGPDARKEDFKKANRNLRCQVGLKERFRKGVIISGAYLEEIQNIFNDHGLPVDLAYLPHVESSFNLKAYSKFGAAGIWQFTRSTGKQYMKVGYTVDERRDPIIASHSAAKLLKRNYTKFNNWPMAITAYNHGATGMWRAQRARGSYEEIFKSYRNRTFKFASRNFYSEFLAAREIAKDYRQYFGELQLDTPLETAVVELAGYVSLPELARHLGTDLEVIRALNPALRRPVYTGQKYVPKGYRLRLPGETDRSWENLIAELTTDIYKGKQKHSRFYTTRRGDTAGAIARRHGVELEDLIATNNLNSRATIYVNQTLRIPVPGEEIMKTKASPSVETRKEPVVDEARLLAANQPTPMPVAPPVEAQVALDKKPSAPLDSKTVAQTPVAKEEIDLDRNLNRISSLAASAIFEKLTVERVQELRGMTVGYIRVEVEETLGHYAEWLNVAARDIRRLNGFRYGRMIHLDQRIKVPLHRVSKEEFEEKRIEYHQELAEDFFETYRVESIQTYIVKRGDNVWSLAKEEFDVPMWLIKRYNIDVNFSELMPSQKLRVPLTVKKVS
jgi:membrane-bound lytic murein transglycosylase D